MDAIALIIGGLVTWRVSYMLVKEDGPLFMFARMRAYLAKNQQKKGVVCYESIISKRHYNQKFKIIFRSLFCRDDPANSE